MIKDYVFFAFCCALALIVASASAVPTTGEATMIGSNNVTIPLTDVTGSDAWVIWGYNPDGEVWITSNASATGGVASGYIWGAPLTGNTLYYAKGCDPTGCGNEVSFTTAAVTPIPASNFGAGFRNITDTHFNPVRLAPAIMLAYFNIIPATIFFGILLGIIVLGLWRRNRSVRLVSVVFIILSPLVMSSSIGLNFGVPLMFQALGQALLAAGVAGMLLSLVRK